MFFYQLWLEVAIAVARNIDMELPFFANQGFAGIAIPAVIVAGGLMLIIAKMIFHLGI